MDIRYPKKCSADILPIELPGDSRVGMAVIKQTYIIENGLLCVADNQDPVYLQDIKKGGREFFADTALPKAGVDLVIVGDAVAPDGRKVPRLDVAISMGNIRKTFAVFGNRHWRRTRDEQEKASARDLEDLQDLMQSSDDNAATSFPDEDSFPKPPETTPESDEDDDKTDKDESYEISNPVPFARMSIGWSNAYGGSSGFESQYADNPDGKGYILPPVLDDDMPHIHGVPLPNVEYAGNLIKEWTDRPSPAGCDFYPMFWGMRMSAGLQIRGMRPPCLLPALFNQAHPDFVFDHFPSAERLKIVNMSQPDPVEVSLKRPSLRARLGRGDTFEQLTIKWDLICVMPERKKVYIVGRTLFIDKPDCEYPPVIYVEETE